MHQPSREELLAKMAAIQKQLAQMEPDSGMQAEEPRSVTAGDRGVAIGGDLNGNIIVPAAEDDPVKAIADYLKWLDLTHSAVRGNEIFKGVTDTKVDPLQLRSVFVDLNVTFEIEEKLTYKEYLQQEKKRRATLLEKMASTKNRNIVVEYGEQQREQRQVRVFEILGAYSRLVLIGDPGCGKSTIGQFVTLALARARMKDESLLKRLGPDWTHGPLLPVPIVLRDFAASQPSPDVRGRANDLWKYLGKFFQDCGKEASWVNAIRQEADEHGAIFMLDGWDETSDPMRLAWVAEAIADLIKNSGGKCRFLLTTRPYAWQTVHLYTAGKEDPGFAHLASSVTSRIQAAFAALHSSFEVDYFVAPLDSSQTQQFIENWYQAVQAGEHPWFSAKEAKLKKADLEVASTREDLRPVVTNPLLLTLTASLSAQHLPDDRADLYNEIVELLLKHWTKRIGSDLSLREAVGCSIRLEDIRQKIEECAFNAHRGHVGQQGVADIPEFALKTAFSSLLEGSEDRAKKVVEFVEKRAGLLISKGLKAGSRQFCCPHRTFQEFLAGCYLSAKNDFTSTKTDAKDDQMPSALALARENPGHWREVLCFAARQAKLDRGSLVAHILVYGRSFKDRPQSTPPTDTDWRCALVAGRQLLEIGLAQVPGNELIKKRVEDVADWLGALLEKGGLKSLRERLDAAECLAKLGDLRPGVGLRPDGLPDIQLVPKEPEPPLPAGLFKLGETQQEVSIKWGYRLSRYLITVAQFQAFAKVAYDVANPQAREWWGQEGWDWKIRESITGPDDNEPVFQTPNHPQVGVSWYEAAAYCAWLTQQLHAKGELAKEDVIRLPEEGEWEQAARWNRRAGAADERYYPWGGKEGDASLPQKCNMRQTGINHTSAVGMFPEGNAECGASDMSGNVWEWCDNWYEENTKSARVLRGGSWVSDGPEFLSGSYCLVNPPGGRDGIVGFRVVLAVASAR